MIWRLLPLLAFVGIAALLFAGIRLSTQRPADVLPSVLIDRAAPAFVRAGLREGEGEIDSRRFLGKPWLLNVWGSWCVTCRVEHPQLMALGRRDDVVLVGLNLRDEPDDARRWLDRYGDPYDAIPVDPDSRVAIDYGVYRAPETFVIDARGVIRHKFSGAITPEDVDRILLPLLARLAGETAP